ncbi:MAG TPA: TlpA disulfide reductase family protein [Anaerolineaceae bacterium]|jgi:peroxiredoxin|nr:TlpA family protein disulfide reductase [Longilinea sp.]HNS62917.1 TlpA disulfide reductase family protein [Anaerolineaceae bacterium]HNZ00956.1 TlpA disulfide reductase family protein [Anaerolineaceae bacterium]HOD45633.1 TlpA disulfide reductase family protein [Anaerolineaceae bacterium]HOH19407.1 TlpA disulfide reductase family protein [Anaerolineaceae bacterium]
MNWIIRHFTPISILSIIFSILWIGLTSFLLPLPVHQSASAPRAGFSAPDFSLPDLQGSSLQLGDLKGKVVILNFWASWCSPCKAEMPAFQSVYSQWKEEGIEIVAVNTTSQDSLAGIQSFVSSYQLSFPILLDSDGSVNQLYRVQALPTTFLIDRQGMIREVIIGGPVPEASLIQKVEMLIKE